MFSFGFYNSKEGDRKYNATHFGKIFDGIIKDGVFKADSNDANEDPALKGAFFVEALSTPAAMVYVNPGKAWFMHTWNILDSRTTISIPTVSTPTNKRTDTIVIEVNNNWNEDGYNTRTNSLKIIQGTEVAIGDGSSPDVPPVLKQEWNANHSERRIWQYPIANVTMYGQNINVGVNTFKKDVIENINITQLVDPTSKPENSKYVSWTPSVSGATMNLDPASYMPISEWKASFDQMILDDIANYNAMVQQLDDLTPPNLETLKLYIDHKLQYGTENPIEDGIELDAGQFYFQIEEY